MPEGHPYTYDREAIGGNSVIRRWAILFVALAISLFVGPAPVCAQSASSATSAPNYGAGAGAAGLTNSGTQSQSPYSGSVPGKLVSGVLPLSLQDALDRGLKQNLGLLLSNENIRSARGERWTQLSKLLPNVTTQSSVVSSQIDLATLGISFPGIPTVVGPFSYFDSRAYLTQTLFDWKAINYTRSATQ